MKNSIKAKNYNNNYRNKNEVDFEKSARQYVDNLLRNGQFKEVTNGEMELPQWYNAELCKKGQDALSHYRFVMTGGMLLGLISVLTIPSILKLLISTKQSSSNPKAYKRYMRTIFHTILWHSEPFVPGSKSWQSLAMVRRAHFKSSKFSSRKNTGFISQKDMALTQFGFFGFLILDTKRVGIIDTDYFEGTVHLWRTIGYMLGISDEFNLCANSWETTKPRLAIIQDEIFKPALEKTSPEFLEMTTALINGLWAHLPTLSVGSFLFFTKRLAGCEGYEYFENDFYNGKRIAGKKQCYDDLSFLDRTIVSYGLFCSNILYHYSVFRMYLNFTTWFNFKMTEHFPLLPMILYGIKTAYVRIFIGRKVNELQIE